jgi:hypothetical protein
MTANFAADVLWFVPPPKAMLSTVAAQKPVQTTNTMAAGDSFVSPGVYQGVRTG